MSNCVVKVEGLSKKYTLRHEQRERYTALRDVLTNKAKSLGRRMAAPFVRGSGPCTNSSQEEFWALKDVSFEIEQGDRVGIIGRNGAGKSTLLKVISRITEPTSGRVSMKGRVASLLEVGTGFHPELTGRENIFLNGAILGMSRAEIRRKFDEIVDFAEIERFLDTPVKRYSSGMYVRLAFAVAAHLEPEILLVDEVLAVGDIEFQKKCIGKMEKVSGDERTVIVVSHSMSTVKALCSKAMLLDRGVMKVMGQVDTVVAEYVGASKVDDAEKAISDKDHDPQGGTKMRVKQVKLLNGASNGFSVYWQQPISVAMDLEVFEDVDEVSFGAGIKMLDGTWVLSAHHDDYGARPRWAFAAGRYTIRFALQNNLRPGIYRLCVGAHHEHYMRNLFHLEPVNLEVLDHTQQGSVPFVYNPGIVNGSSNWETPERIG